MNDLTFSCNWNNKLDCDAFTTIRFSTRFRIGQEYKIILRLSKHNVETKGIAKVVAMKDFLLKDLNEFMAYIDTGYSITQTKEIIRRMNQKFKIDYSKQRLYFLLLNYVKDNKTNLGLIINQAVELNKNITDEQESYE